MKGTTTTSVRIRTSSLRRVRRLLPDQNIPQAFDAMARGWQMLTDSQRLAAIENRKAATAVVPHNGKGEG